MKKVYLINNEYGYALQESIDYILHSIRGILEETKIEGEDNNYKIEGKQTLITIEILD